MTSVAAPIVTTALSQVEGAAGRLSFRGVSIEALADKGYAAVAAFLVDDRWPVDDGRAFAARLLLHTLPTHAPAATTMVGAMAALRRSLTDVEAVDDRDVVAVAGAAARLVGRLRGRQPRRVDFVGSILEGVSDRPIDDDDVAALDAAMVLHLDHALNPGTLAVRVAASTGASVAACLTAGLCALEGPLHGGASSDVGAVLERLVQRDDAVAAVADFVVEERAAKRRLPGFGHPIYKGRDPRTAILRGLTEQVARRHGDARILDVAVALEAAAIEQSQGRLFANVDFYAAALYASLGIPLWLHTPMFAAARFVGWAAHVVEARARGKIISPKGGYDGPAARTLRSVMPDR